MKIESQFISDKLIIELAIKAGYPIVNASENPPSYPMRMAIQFARNVLAAQKEMVK